MRLHWIAMTFLLGFIIILDPTHTPAQPGFGKKGKGGGGDGGDRFPGGKGGGDRFPGGGGGFPGGGREFSKGGGGFPTPAPGGGVTTYGATSFPQPGGGGFPGGGGGFPGGGGGFPGGGGGFPGGGGGPGGFGGGRGGGGGAEGGWNMLVRSTGSTGDTIDLSRISPQSRDWMRQRAERDGSLMLPESGIMTKDQYLDFYARSEAAKASRSGGGGGPGGPMMVSLSGNGPMAGGPMSMTIGPDGRMNMGRGPGGGNERDRGLERHTEQDRDRDGRVSRDEADRQLQPNFDRIDVDRDGYITLDEYRGYYAAQNQGRDRNNNDNNNNWGMGGWGGDMGGWGNRMDPRRELEEPKPIAMRYGHLPKDLPEWFDSDDSNKDGQVALHEWRKAGKSVVEFNSYDLNSDQLITADEMVRFKRQKDDAERIAAILDGTSSPRPSFGTGPRGPRGPGGPGGPPGPGGIPTTVTLPGSTPDTTPASTDRERPGKGPNRDSDKNSEKREDKPGSNGLWGTGGKKGRN
jgi:hypothetical protein